MEVLKRGDRVGVYEIVEVIGYGGSIVYHAVDTHLERNVALKVVYPQTVVDPSYAERFRREGKTHSKLNHPNIVRVFAADKGEHGLWIAMELMPGGTLRSKLRGQPLDPREALDLLAPIADALDYAHRRGSIHRDVKPENVLLDDRGIPHLSDFGIVKNLGEPSLTKTGRGLGTEGYASPEQEKGERVGPESDVYSLTVVLFECLVGGRLFPPVTGERTRRRKRLIPRARNRNPALPAAIEPVLQKGLSEAPKSRYRSAGALIAAAGEALDDSEPGESQDEVNWMYQWLRHRRGAVLASGAGCLIVLFGLAAGVIARGSDSSASPVSAATDNLAIEAPPGWRRQQREEAVLGLGVKTPIVLEPPPGADAVPPAVTAGVSAASGPSLLPTAYGHQRAANEQLPGSVHLGDLQAYRYTGLREPGSRLPAMIYVSPTTLGVVTVACRLPSGTEEARAAARLCDEIAGTVRLREGRGYRLGPSAGFARVLRKRLSKLSRRRDKALSRLRSAGDGSAQAAAAESLADAFREAGSGLKRVRVSPQSKPARQALLTSVQAAGSAYGSLAVAAREEDAGRYAAATEAAEFAEDSSARNLRALGALGYQVKTKQSGEVPS
ncbi:MAG TPA: serine/threonine-protein kinase [Solirubrobacterales bacterium]|nr:serine/threonine-protein kinase [Solirubrobacterales bacterium]